jgi:hypothetical protein
VLAEESYRAIPGYSEWERKDNSKTKGMSRQAILTRSISAVNLLQAT